MTQQRRITPSGWLAIALATYIVLFGFAYEFLANRPNLNSATGSVAANTEALADSSENAATALTNTIETAVNPSLEVAEQVTGTVLPAIETVSPDLSANVESLRAQISFPSNGSVVDDADGWVQLQGQVFLQEEAERFFIVLESPNTNPPVVYPQQEIAVSAAGEWTALVRYGSPGQSYRTYVISTNDSTAVDALFSHEALAGLPNGFDIVSNVNVNSVSVQ